MKIRTLVSASAFAVAMALAATAQAQSYGRIVSFGDSLSDVGNLGPFAPPAPYAGGRFSNGPVWTERLGFTQVGVGGPVTGSVNYAYGGARTGTEPVFPPPPGIQTQISEYFGDGGTFDGDDLVTVWGGANNIFQGFTPASVSPDPIGAINATALAAAADMGLIVNTIAAAGAGTILVPNLPNLAATPQFAGGPAVPLANAATQTFNGALLSQLNGVAALRPNTNIILMDTYRAFEAVRISPARFGFTNVTAPCFNGVSVCSTPGTYAYWDGVHPTAAGHQLIAQLATDYLYYADLGAHAALQGEYGVRQRGEALDAALDQVGMADFGGLSGGLTGFVGYQSAETEARGAIPDAELTLTTFGAAVAGQVSPSLRAGILGQAATGETEAGAVTFDVETVSLDAFAGWRSGRLFVNAAAGVSRDGYENIRRPTPIPGVVNLGSTQGLSYGAKLEGGMVFGLGGWSLVPRLGIAWQRAEIDGYWEEGDVSARHEYQDRTVELVAAEAMVTLQGQVSDGVGAFIEAGYRDNLSYDGDVFTVGLQGNPATPLEVLAEDPEGGQALVGAGLSGRLSETITLSARYSGRMGDSFDSHTGHISLTVAF